MSAAVPVHDQLQASVALERRKDSEMQVASPSPMHLLQMAVQQGAAIDTIERLAKLQREMIEYDAKVAFNDAMERVQSKMKRVGADLNNPQTKSRYASYAKLDSAIRPIYSAEGFSLSFNTADSPIADNLRVICDVSRGGHVKTYQIDMPADGKGAKGGDVMTKTHATGAAASYGMRYLLKMIFNIAVGEEDIDGNMPPNKGMEEDEFQRLCGLIEGAGTIESLKTIYLAACKDAGSDKAAIKVFAKLKDARYKELYNASR